MNELTIIAKVVLANTFLMYFKAHSYHWNVESKNFAEMHSFFGGLYDELFAAIDPIAEEIRAMDSYAPISLMEMYGFKTISEDEVKPSSVTAMLSNLLTANEQVVESLNRLFKAATDANNQGFANFIADRLDKHAKHGWQLRAFLKGGE